MERKPEVYKRKTAREVVWDFIRLERIRVWGNGGDIQIVEDVDETDDDLLPF